MTESFSSAETNHRHFKTLNDYESWVAENWLHPPGSDEAQLHVRAKLDEEVKELGEALEKDRSDDIKAELGDVLWTSTAVAINEGFEAKGEPIFLDEIDRLARDRVWDEPVLGVLYGLSSERITEKLKAGDTAMTKQVMESLTHQLGKAGRMAHRFADQFDYSNSKHNTFGSAWLEVQQHRLVDARAQILLLASLIAQDRLQLSLADIMQANYAKLTARISSGQPITK